MHAFREVGQKTTSIEMDNFLTDRDYREEKGIHTQGKEALHLKLLTRLALNRSARVRRSLSQDMILFMPHRAMI